jgi:uncharacterized OB-fold protein
MSATEARRSARPNRTLGPGHDTFWEWCARGELRLPRCTGCGKLLWPVASACDHCGGGAFTWERQSGRARLVGWNVFAQSYFKGVLDTPYTTILVELEDGPLFVANPVGFGEADMAPGLALELRFVPARDQAGDFDLPVFALAEM